MRNIFVAILMFSPASAILAAESADFAKMARLSWSAFECSSLASVLEKSKDQEQLFRVGYEQGKKFITAVDAGRVSSKDLKSIVPSGFLMVAQGPSADFILGRVYESAQDNSLKEVITPETVLDKDLKKAIASRKYASANCDLIGNAH